MTAKNKAEKLLLLFTKNKNTLIKKRKSQEKLEFKLLTRLQTFSFNTPLELKVHEWMLGSINLEHHNFVFNINKKVVKLNCFDNKFAENSEWIVTIIFGDENGEDPDFI